MLNEVIQKFLLDFVEASCFDGKMSCPDFVEDQGAWTTVIQTVCRWGMQASLAEAIQRSDWTFKIPRKTALKIEERNAQARLLSVARKHELETVRKILKEGGLPVLFIGRTALRQRFDSRKETGWQFASTVIELGCSDLRRALLVLGKRGYRCTSGALSTTGVPQAAPNKKYVELFYGNSPNRVRLYEVLSTEQTVIDFKSEEFLDWTVRLTRESDDWLLSPETLLLLQGELGVDLSLVPKQIGLGMKYIPISESWLGNSYPKRSLSSLFRFGKDARK
jgi:hypothetical protein